MIITTSNRITHRGNGLATTFPFNFPILERTNILVYLVDIDGVEKNITKDFFVDTTMSAVIYPGYPPGEEPPEIDRPPVLPTGWSIIIYREVPLTQETDFGDRHPLPQVESGDDKNTMISQQLSERMDRKFGVPISISNFDFTMPTPLKGGAVLAVKDDLTGLEYGTTLGDLDGAISTSNEAKVIANNALNKSTEALSTANNALDKSTSATTTSNEAKTIASEAKVTANEAKTSASEAKTLSTTANSNSSNALSIANSAKDTADKISGTANTALSNSKNALTIANSAKDTAEGIAEKANEALTLATDASSKVNAFDTRITTNTTNISGLTTRTTSLETRATQHELEATTKWIILNNLENKVNTINGVPSFDSTDANKVLTISGTAASMGWETSQAIRIWKPSTAVVLGQIMYPTSVTSPLAYECIKAGTTGTTEPTGVVMQAVSDGTAKWGIFDIRKRTPEIDGSFELKNWTTPKSGYHVANGSTLTNLSTNYPSLYRSLQGGEVMLLTTSAWATMSASRNNGIGGVPYFGYDGGDTCILPDVRDMYFRGSGTYNVQDYHGDAIRNITGSFQAANATSFQLATGAFIQSGAGAYMPLNAGSGTLLGIQMYFNAGNSGVPTGPENVPKTIVQIPVLFTGYKGV